MHGARNASSNYILAITMFFMLFFVVVAFVQHFLHMFLVGQGLVMS